MTFHVHPRNMSLHNKSFFRVLYLIGPYIIDDFSDKLVYT